MTTKELQWVAQFLLELRKESEKEKRTKNERQSMKDRKWNDLKDLHAQKFGYVRNPDFILKCLATALNKKKSRAKFFADTGLTKEQVDIVWKMLSPDSKI